MLRATQQIETQCDRTSKGNYDPRTLDIDILFYGSEIVSSTDLIIPHPLLHEREFVLKPLAEIAPHFIHPIMDQSVEMMASQLEGY